MAGQTRDFDPELVTVTWALPAGAIDLTPGLIDAQNAIRSAKAVPRASRKTDRQGNQVRRRTRNRSGSLFLTYQAEAQIQATLTAIMDLEDGGVPQVGPIVVRNLNGDELFTYAGAAIDNDPDEAFGSEASDRVYEFGYAARIPIAAGTPAVGG